MKLKTVGSCSGEVAAGNVAAECRLGRVDLVVGQQSVDFFGRVGTYLQKMDKV